MSRSPLLFIFTMLLSFALAACGRSPKPALPEPHPVGQWQWSNPLLGSWRLELKADGTFQREVVDRLEPKPVSVSGKWTLDVKQPTPTWFERHGIFQKTSAEEEFLHTAGVDASKRNTIQLSAAGTLTLYYYVPNGTKLADGAAWTTPTVSEALLGSAPAGSTGLAEKHPLRTLTDTSSGEVFLYVEGKTFRRSTGAITTNGASTTGVNSDFLNLEAFFGIALDLPKDWLAKDPDAPATPPVPVGALAGKPRAPKPNNSLRFVPPSEPEGIYVLLNVQAPSFTAQQVTDASQIELERFAAGYVKGFAHALEPKGYFLKPEITAERVTVGKFTSVSCEGRTIDPMSNIRTIRVFTIPTGSATVILACCWDPEAGTPWKAIAERAFSSLRVAESFRLATP